ncbi:MAG TPA: hypothetical protein DEA26_10990 [Oceanospirillales bacterium]|nr:hypothetical protein [Oceanospirillaceae bacterium]HBS43199.1 hypothetical protein [Oceanospirillales bacterium]|tara:strand:- start:15104 stop:15955 length:852 start_codon:yes stop_codon:yes gene_type:complete
MIMSLLKAIWAVLPRLPAVLLLAGAITLLQLHAIAWWSEHDASYGWLWAVVIEAGAIWLWASRRWYCNVIAVFATALALIVPLSELAQPVLDDQRTAQTAADTLPQRTAAAEARIRSLEASLAQYNANSRSRAGWYGLIESTQQQLTAARADLAQLQAETAPAPAELSLWLPLAVQMISMVLLQCLIVLTTRRIFAPVNVDPVIKSRDDEESAPAGEAAEGFSGDSRPEDDFRWLTDREAQRDEERVQAFKTAVGILNKTGKAEVLKPTALHPAQDAAATSLP